MDGFCCETLVDLLQDMPLSFELDNSGDLPSLSKKEMKVSAPKDDSEGGVETTETAPLTTTTTTTAQDDNDDDGASSSSLSLLFSHKVTPEKRNSSKEGGSSSPDTVILSSSPPKVVVSSPSSSSSSSSSSPISDSVNHILDGKTPSEADVLLRSMVVDLMQEVDTLKSQNKEQTVKINDLNMERDIMKKDYRDNLFGLLLAVQKATGEKDDDNKGDDNTVDALVESDKILPTSEAMELVIGKLTKKIEQLNIENSNLIEQIQSMQEKIDDLQGVNETRLLKIDALEGQFKNINKQRFTVCHKLLDTKSTTTTTAIDNKKQPAAPSRLGRFSFRS